MKTEEKQLLIKDLCARLLYGVKVRLDTGDKAFDTDLVGLPCNITVNIHDKENYETIEECFIWNIKPYLRPMSSMTEEEEIYYNTVYFTLNFYKKEDWLNKNMFDYRGLIPMGLALEAKEGMYKTE